MEVALTGLIVDSVDVAVLLSTSASACDQYDAATQSVNATVQNATSQQFCYMQAELHLKSGKQTIGEPVPLKMGDLNPEQTVMSSLSVAG